MSVPTEVDFALVKLGDGGAPEVFTAVCGIQDATINKTVNTTDRQVRDCTKPGSVPDRKVKVTGKQMDVTGSGLTNKDSIAILDAALGAEKNYTIECYENDGTDAGNLLGTYSLPAVMTADNMTVPIDGEASAEFTLASNGAWTWVAAA